MKERCFRCQCRGDLIGKERRACLGRELGEGARILRGSLGMKLELLRELKREGIHTALDTSGYTDTFAFTQVLPYVDMLLYDIKHMDPIKHREGTGVDNQKILDHFRLAQDKKKQTLVRVPVIPGYNDTEENWTALAELLHSYPNTQIELLGYHAYGQPKYEALGMVYKLADLKAPSDKEMAIHKAFLRNYGVNCME